MRFAQGPSDGLPQPAGPVAAAYSHPRPRPHSHPVPVAPSPLSLRRTVASATLPQSLRASTLSAGPPSRLRLDDDFHHARAPRDPARAPLHADPFRQCEKALRRCSRILPFLAHRAAEPPSSLTPAPTLPQVRRWCLRSCTCGHGSSQRHRSASSACSKSRRAGGEKLCARALTLFARVGHTQRARRCGVLLSWACCLELRVLLRGRGVRA